MTSYKRQYIGGPGESWGLVVIVVCVASVLGYFILTTWRDM